MKKLFIASVTIILLSAWNVAVAQSTSETETPESRQGDLLEIERLEDEWNRINEVSDADGKQRLLADDSYHVGPSGRVYTKQQDVEDARLSYERKQRDKSITKFHVENRRIRLYRDVAVVTATGRAVVTRDGQERRGRPFRGVHVWERRKGGWLLVVDQVTAAGN